MEGQRALTGYPITGTVSSGSETMVTTGEACSCTVVAVGERDYDRRLSVEAVAWLRHSWAKDPVSAMLRQEAFQRGARFERYGAVAAYRVNLLPPDRRIGTWEPATARGNAFRLATGWPVEDLGAPRFLLLGRRVVDAFSGGEAAECPVSGGGRLEFGTIFFAWDRPCIALPHPSGRNRWWHGDGKSEEVRRWLDVFTRCFSC